MSNEQRSPIKILTNFRPASPDNWPGEVPVEFYHANDVAGLAALLPGMDVFVGFIFTPQMGATADQLKLIQIPGIGTDYINFASVPEGCLVANVSGHEIPIAEWIIMTMLALSRELIKADRTLRAGSWEMSPWQGTTFSELNGRTLGIIGLGQIGRKTAEYAPAFNMRLIAATRTVPSEAEALALGFTAVYGLDKLDTLLQEADFLLIAVPLTDATRGLIDKRALALMKPTAYLINVARAEIVDEEALFAALQSKQIRGAALDVWYQEPASPGNAPIPATQPFWELDNVIMSPHASSVTSDMNQRRLAFMAQNIDRWARGEPVQNVVKG
jgi:phosphoglycerate dehydrogenase-like enzyme